MNIILNYNKYLKRVYPTQALITFNNDKTVKLALTKDKQIKQEFTGGKSLPDEEPFELKYIENNNNIFILNGGDPQSDML